VLERDGLADEKQPDPLRRMAENFLAQATRQGYPAEDVLHALILAVEQMQQPDVRNMPSSDAEDTPGKQTMFHVKHG